MDSPRDIDWEHIRTLKFLGLEDGLELRQGPEGEILKVPHSTSPTRLERFIRSRQDYYEVRISGTSGGDDADHLRLGTLTHMGTLEPERFATEVVEAVRVPQNTTPGRVAHEAMDRGLEIIEAPYEKPSLKGWKTWAEMDGVAQAGQWKLWQDACAVYVPPKDYKQACEFYEALETVAKAEFVATPEQYTQATLMSEAVRANPDAAKWLRLKGLAEEEVHWTDEETGIEIFAHPDWVCFANIGGVPTLVIVDLKTTADPRIKAMTGSVDKWGYARQAAVYATGAAPRIAAREGWRFQEVRYFIVAVRNERPHDVCTYELTPDWIDLGARQFRHHLRRLRWCLDNDDWRLPESKATHELIAPEYVFQRELGYEVYEEGAKEQ